MDVFFVDDARQTKPSRDRMGPLVAIGGLRVPGDAVRSLGRALDTLCKEAKFPDKEIFKWSPGTEHWMRTGLTGPAREQFFCEALKLCKSAGASAIVIIEDKSRKTATGAASAEEDVVRLLFERINHRLMRDNAHGTVVFDRPGGQRSDEEKFLATCLDVLESGTKYVLPERIILSVSSVTKLIRLLQVADVITSCTLAMVAGENRFAPTVFEAIKPLLDRELGRIGGVGLKIHPDYLYVNLYRWILEDKNYVRGVFAAPLPFMDRWYALDPLSA